MERSISARTSSDLWRGAALQREPTLPAAVTRPGTASCEHCGLTRGPFVGQAWLPLSNRPDPGRSPGLPLGSPASVAAPRRTALPIAAVQEGTHVTAPLHCALHCIWSKQAALLRFVGYEPVASGSGVGWVRLCFIIFYCSCPRRRLQPAAVILQLVGFVARRAFSLAYVPAPLGHNSCSTRA